MACLDNYILVKGHCEGNTPSSNLYINVNLPGITLEKAANTAEGAIVTGVGLLNQAITNGIARTRQELMAAMLGTVRFNQIISGGDYGQWDLDNYLTASAAERGLKIELSKCCRLGRIHVQRVGYLFNTSGARILKITDEGTVTNFSFTATAKVPGFIETKYTANSDRIYLTMDNSATSVNNSFLCYSGYCGNCTNTCTGRTACGCSNGLIVNGWDGTNENSTTYGLSPMIQVICDSEKFFCEISHLEMTEWAVLYASGIDFLNYVLNTNRINVYTIYNEEEAIRTIDLWEAKFKERKETLVKTLPKYLNSIDSCCLECDAPSYGYAYP